MTDQEYIRKAVELAKEWWWKEDCVHCTEIPMHFWDDALPTMILDAIAAQLVRQVGATSEFFVDSDRYGTAKVWRGRYEQMYRVAKSNDEDRTMNTIKAIIDSKVLDAEA